LDKINKTQLDIEKAEERGLVHRDYISHCLRWNYALKFIDVGARVLDVGSGNGMLAQVLYVNKYRPEKYVGVDIRPSAIQEMLRRKTNFPKQGKVFDIRFKVYPKEWENHFDIVTCFEVIEHFEKQYLNHVLSQIRVVLKPEGLLLLSTPNYDGIHQVANHVHEYYWPELKAELIKHFKIEKTIGTFASQKDLKPVMTREELFVFEEIKDFLDSNIISVVFASVHPYNSRNILWVCRKNDKI